MNTKSEIKCSNSFLWIILISLISFGCQKGENIDDLSIKDGLFYAKDSLLYSGLTYKKNINGKDSLVAIVDSGLFHGNYLIYHTNGQIKDSIVYNKGSVVDVMQFNPDGTPNFTEKDLNYYWNKDTWWCYTKSNEDTVLFTGSRLDTIVNVISDNPEKLYFRAVFYKGLKLKGLYCYENLQPYTGKIKTVKLNNKKNSISIMEVKAGKLHGKHRHINEEYSYEEEFTYVNGVKEGEWVKKSYAYGHESTDRGNYINDKREGRFTHFSDKEGHLLSEHYYVNDEFDGKQYSYWINTGGLRSVYNYVNGLREGMSWSEDSDGSKTEMYFSKTVLKKMVFYNPDGSYSFTSYTNY